MLLRIPRVSKIYSSFVEEHPLTFPSEGTPLSLRGSLTRLFFLEVQKSSELSRDPGLDDGRLSKRRPGGLCRSLGGCRRSNRCEVRWPGGEMEADAGWEAVSVARGSKAKRAVKQHVEPVNGE